MKTNLKSERSGIVSQSSVTSFRGNVSRRSGTLRAVTVKSRVMDIDHIFGMATAIEEAIVATFGDTAHDLRLAADRNMYRLNPFNNAADALTQDSGRQEVGPCIIG